MASEQAGLTVLSHEPHPKECPVIRSRHLLLPAAGLAIALLAGCTTYTFPDGSQETLWGVPTEDETLTQEERQQQAPRYRVPGEIPEREAPPAE